MKTGFKTGSFIEAMNAMEDIGTSYNVEVSVFELEGANGKTYYQINPWDKNTLTKSINPALEQHDGYSTLPSDGSRLIAQYHYGPNYGSQPSTPGPVGGGGNIPGSIGSDYIFANRHNVPVYHVSSTDVYYIRGGFFSDAIGSTKIGNANDFINGRILKRH